MLSKLLILKSATYSNRRDLDRPMTERESCSAENHAISCHVKCKCTIGEQPTESRASSKHSLLRARASKAERQARAIPNPAAQPEHRFPVGRPAGRSGRGGAAPGFGAKPPKFEACHCALRRTLARLAPRGCHCRSLQYEGAPPLKLVDLNRNVSQNELHLGDVRRDF